MDTNEKLSAIIKPRRAWRRWLKRIGCGLLIVLIPVLILLILAVPAQMWRHRLIQQRLDEALAELDHSDPGWRLEDIEAAREQIPEGENSARIVAVAGSLLPKDWKPQEIEHLRNDLAPEERLPLDALVRLGEELDAVRPALEEARKIAGLARGRHRIQYARNIIGTLLKDQSKVPPLTQLLLGDAMRHEQEGNMDQAMMSCRAAFNAGRSLGDEPFAVSQLIRTQNIVRSCRGIERLLAQGEPSLEALSALQQLLSNEDDFPDLLVSMRGERAADHAMFDGLESGDVPISDNPDWEAYFSGFLFRDQLREEHPRMLSLMSRWLATARLPPREQAAAEAQLDQEASNIPKTDRFTRLLALAFAKVGDASRLKHALLRCTIVALAAERYRRKHQTWPESLDKLCPDYLSAVPQDPLDGARLRYRQVGNGAIVYSVSTDGIDNNGNLDPNNVHDPGVDIGVRLWDVAKRRQPPRPKPPDLKFE